MQRSYIDYAMSVIVGRALPEVRDGLKPVHRRVLYAMYDAGFRPDRSYASARARRRRWVTTTRTATRRSTTPWCGWPSPGRCAIPLVDGQGNFGSPGNDPASRHEVLRYRRCACASAVGALGAHRRDRAGGRPN